MTTPRHVTDMRDLCWPDPMPTEEEMRAAIKDGDEKEFALQVIDMLYTCTKVRHWGPLQDFIDFWWGGETDA